MTETITRGEIEEMTRGTNAGQLRWRRSFNSWYAERIRLFHGSYGQTGLTISDHDGPNGDRKVFFSALFVNPFGRKRRAVHRLLAAIDRQCSDHH